MCTEQETDQAPDYLHRRSFLKASGAVTAMAFVGTGAPDSQTLRAMPTAIAAETA